MSQPSLTSTLFRPLGSLRSFVLCQTPFASSKLTTLLFTSPHELSDADASALVQLLRDNPSLQLVFVGDTVEMAEREGRALQTLTKAKCEVHHEIADLLFSNHQDPGVSARYKQGKKNYARCVGTKLKWSSSLPCAPYPPVSTTMAPSSPRLSMGSCGSHSNAQHPRQAELDVLRAKSDCLQSEAYLLQEMNKTLQMLLDAGASDLGSFMKDFLSTNPGSIPDPSFPHPSFS